MSTVFKQKIKKYWKEFLSLQQPFGSTLSAGEQTRSSWPRMIESYDSMPDIYNTFFDDLLKDDNDKFPYMVLAPARGGFLQKNVEKLICEYKDSIYIIERNGTWTQAKKYPIDTIRDIEVGTHLLDSWIKIRGLTEDGILTTSILEYNSVASAMLATIIDTIRGIPNDKDSTELINENRKFDYLEPLNFKFWYYAQKSICSGERVILSVLQPEYKIKRNHKLSWLFPQKNSSPHLTIVTNKELVLIRDNETPEHYKGNRYGGIWHFIPVDNITAISITEENGERLKLSVYISDGGCIERLFFHHKKFELLQLKGQIENLVNRN